LECGDEQKEEAENRDEEDVLGLIEIKQL